MKRNLAGRLPGQALMEAIAKGDATGDRDAWYLGLEGEREVARALELLGPAYKSVHSIPIPGERRDLDHIVIGPTGVFVINSKNHPGKAILVDDEYLIFGGRRYSEPSDAARDARRAAITLGLKYAVPIVAVSGAASIKVKDDSIAKVCATQDLANFISEGRTHLTEDQVAEIYESVIAPGTWGILESELDDPEVVQRAFSSQSRTTSKSPLERKRGYRNAPRHFAPARTPSQLGPARSSMAARAVTYAIAALVILSVIGRVGSSPAQVSDSPQSTTAKTSGTARQSTPDQVADASLSGSTLENVRAGTYLFRCGYTRKAIATPIGAAYPRGSLYFVPPSSNESCITRNVFQFGMEFQVKVIDAEKGLVASSEVVPAFKVGPRPAAGKYEAVLTTDTEITLIPVVLREASGQLVATVNDSEQPWLVGSPVFDRSGLLVAILDKNGLAIPAQGLSKG